MIDRSITPKFFSPEFKQFPFPSKSNLTNGVSVYSFNKGDQEVFKIEMIFSGGSFATTNPAIPTLCTSMLREGSNEFRVTYFDKDMVVLMYRDKRKIYNIVLK